MKIAILFHSKTGKTAGFSHYLGSELRALGHQAQAFSLETAEEPKWTARQVQLRDLPDLADFDLVVLGGPTWLGPSPVVTSFLAQAPGLAGKSVYPFVTHMVPPFLNGRRALKVLRALSRKKAARAHDGRAVWISFSPSSPKVKATAAAMAKEIAALPS